MTTPRLRLLTAALVLAPAALGAQTGATYAWVYPYNTPDLIEDHYIVLEDSDAGVRGWYYGTSDEFDSAREGYLPGFFVAAMQDLRIEAGVISFTLRRPGRFFASPVPREYRDQTEVPDGRLGEWSVPLPTESLGYTGTISGGEIQLRVRGGSRSFRAR